MFFEWFWENSLKIEECIGIDEVGRGPLAGPVVSGAVWISKEATNELETLNKKMPVRDSKKLSHRQRQNVLEWLKNQPQNAILYSIGEASVSEIDSINIRNAAFLSMKRAFLALYDKIQKTGILLTKSLTILVDGNAIPALWDEEMCSSTQKYDNKAIIKGDSKVLNISLASIIAKEFRDELMKKLSLKYPQYGWNTNVGYGTKEHIQALRAHGITEYHRKSFAPVFKNCI